jgi:hypothetical protein
VSSGAGIILVGHYDALADARGNLETVLVLHHAVVAVDTGDYATTHGIQKSHFITYFHIVFSICYWVCFLTFGLFLWCKDSEIPSKTSFIAFFLLSLRP